MQESHSRIKSQAQMTVSRLVYPALNIYYSPRFYQQRIDHKSFPLQAYINKIESNNITKLFDKPTPDENYLRQFRIEDGMIYQLRNMSKIIQNQALLKIKVLICVCMYNQSKNAINQTLKGIYQNLEHLQKEGISSHEVAVVMLQDGILKLIQDRKMRTYAKGEDSMIYFYKTLDRLDGNKKCVLEERIHTILDEMENFSRKGMDSYIEDNRNFPTSIQKNISLLYQNLWNPSMTDDQDKNIYTRNLKIFSCFKHLNGTKLSSHLWFFQGFCRYLDPEYVVLLDVGTKPSPSGILNLLKGFDNYNVGGVTGLMSVDSSLKSEQGGEKKQIQDGAVIKCIKQTFFSIQKAQEYEYIISHFIDKNAQGALGFLHVLPGAWSAYRYRALIKSDDYEPNLLEHSYFKMILNPQLEEKDYREANMYLAEDRILSLGIYCQNDSKYYLKYVPNAIAKTDPMTTHEDLMKQRRRWINSSLFAFLYVWKSYSFNVQQSSHNCFDKYVKLNISMLISALSFLTSYFTPALYFYVLFETIYQIDPDNTVVSIIAKVVSIAYVIILLVAIAGGLMGNIWTKYAHSVSACLTVFTFAMWGLVTYNIVAVYLSLNDKGIDWTNFSQMSILVMVGINLVGFFINIILHIFTHRDEVLRLLADQISYLAYQGAYSQTMVIHAFCNIDDVSWGTKGSSSSGGKKYQNQKISFVASWLFYNAILSFIFIYVDIVIPNYETGPEKNRKIMLIIIAIYGTAQMLIKLILAICHQIKYIIIGRSCCVKELEPQSRKIRVEQYWITSNNQYKEAFKKMKLNR